MRPAPLLSMQGIEKAYGAVRANQGVDLDVPDGRIVGLLGENGSGKSTLMKILFGMVRPDSGAMLWRGQEYAPRSPADALRAGIGMIHQHFTLAEGMTVAENVALGWPGAGRWWLRRGHVADQVRTGSAAYGLSLEPDSRVADLSLGARQRVEILKALLRGARLLVLDEPTSVLGPAEVAGLLQVMRRLQAGGCSVVLISHKLHEVAAVCDEVVVLRDGRTAARLPRVDATPARLAALLSAAGPALPIPAAAMPGPVRLRLDGVGLRGQLDSVSLDLRAGEVLGLAGTDGNGQQELAEVAAGLRRPDAGCVALDGADATAWSARRRMRAGVAYVPADRRGESLVPGMTLAENLAMRDLQTPGFSRWGVLRTAAAAARARAAIVRFGIRAPGPGMRVGGLSGGNQQKVALARELTRQPGVLLLVQPTWGLDPGAAAAVRAEVLALCSAGAAVLWASTETEELLQVADRIAVMVSGRLAAVLPRAEASPERLALLIAVPAPACAA